MTFRGPSAVGLPNFLAVEGVRSPYAFRRPEHNKAVLVMGRVGVSQYLAGNTASSSPTVLCDGISVSATLVRFDFSEAAFARRRACSLGTSGRHQQMQK